MIKCVSGKKAYATAEIAEDVLIETHTRFDYTSNNGPIAFYKCDDCGYYHLTSKGVMNQKLAEQLASGKIRRQKEADQWLKKIKKNR
jgi:hypothetical protein